MIEAFNQHLSRNEKIIVGLFLSLKLAILLVLPLTGDEAYFISWADQPSLGYYDHPPAVGWTIYLLSFVNDHYFFYRLFAFAIATFVAWLMFRLLEPVQGSSVAILVSMIFLLSPLSLFAVILVNDLVLLLFGVLGFYFFSKALDKESIGLSLLAGIFLGMAFLSKYLSVPLFLGLILYLIFNRKPGIWKLVLIAISVASLFVFENLYFNLQSCWNNVLFNLFSRTSGSGFNAGYIGLFLATLVFAVPPQGLYRLARNNFSQLTPLTKQAFYVGASFLIIFLLASSFKRIGLHWLYLPVTFIYLLFCLLPVDRLRGYLKYNAILSMLVGLILLIVITQFDSLFADHKKYRDALVYTQTETICDSLPKDETIYSLGYSQNSVLSVHCRNNPFHVFANTSKYGREDDKRINYRELDGSTLRILLTDLDDMKKIEEYFTAIEVTTIQMTDEVDYYLVKGNGFSFEIYLSVIKTIKDRFYSPPDWLPAASCEFTKKYGL